MSDQHGKILTVRLNEAWFSGYTYRGTAEASTDQHRLFVSILGMHAAVDIVIMYLVSGTRSSFEYPLLGKYNSDGESTPRRLLRVSSIITYPGAHRTQKRVESVPFEAVPKGRPVEHGSELHVGFRPLRQIYSSHHHTFVESLTHPVDDANCQGVSARLDVSPSAAITPSGFGEAQEGFAGEEHPRSSLQNPFCTLYVKFERLIILHTCPHI